MPGSVGWRSEMNQSPVQVDPAFVWPDYPGNNLHQRAFARAIFANNSVNGAERAGEINIRKGRDATVPFGDPF